MRVKRILATISEVTEQVGYNPETGELFSKTGKNNPRTNNDGYVMVRVNGVWYSGARVAMMLVMGEWPRGIVDHVNGIRSDNRFSNLRQGSQSDNRQNISTSKNNKTGFLGVYPKKGRFCSSITIKGKRIFLGSFETAEEAHAAYLKKKAEVHLFYSPERYINPSLTEQDASR